MNASLLIFLSILILIGIIYMGLVIFVGFTMPHSWYRDVEQSQIENFPEGKIRYTEIGQGSNALVFLHGFNGQIVNWDKVWSELNNCTHAIRLDIPGFGGSEWHSNTFDLESQSKRIQKFLIQRNVDKVILIGTSMGASLSVQMASQYPDLVRGLVLLAPSGYPGSLHHPPPFGYFVKPGIVNRIATSIAETAIYKLFFPDSLALQSLTTASSYTDKWLQALERITVPTMLLWSTGDEVVPYKFMTFVAEKLKNKTVVTLPQSVGHNAPGKAARQIVELSCSMIPLFKMTPQSEKISNENN